jgi:hypothetical protein
MAVGWQHYAGGAGQANERPSARRWLEARRGSRSNSLMEPSPPPRTSASRDPLWSAAALQSADYCVDLDPAERSALAAAAAPNGQPWHALAQPS